MVERLDPRRYRVALTADITGDLPTVRIRGKRRAIAWAQRQATRLRGIAVVALDVPELLHPRVVARFDYRPRAERNGG